MSKNIEQQILNLVIQEPETPEDCHEETGKFNDSDELAAPLEEGETNSFPENPGLKASSLPSQGQGSTDD